ncbi:MAG: monooxygenase, partial [Nocardioidaceae bacterium]|nr:monooxygenase [Nocardioidaceae bacterium]
CRNGIIVPMSYLVHPSDRAPAREERLAPDPSLPTTCVIGAGSSGIAAAKALYEARLPFDCFELGSAVGGTWVYRNPNGQSACYETLEINTSCPRMAYSDFPMPEDYPDYAVHHQIADYFAAYVDHFGFRHTITFDTRVDKVARTDAGRWLVSLTGPDGAQQREYDNVVVANGHHWDARWPDPAYPGTFDGEQIHSHAYNSADQLVGHDVVVVGAGNSAMDIAVEASEVARSAHISQRRGQWVLRKFVLGKPADQVTLPSWLPWWVTSARLAFGARISGNVAKLGLPQPEHKPGQSHPVQSEGIRAALRSGRLTPKPGIERLDGDRVVFTDGSSVPCDLLIWATGYNVTFPFLDAALVSAPGNDLPLWKRMVHPDLPGLFFVGLLQPVGAVMPLAEAQSVLLADLLTGQFVLPPDAELRRQMADDHAAYKKRFYSSARHTMEVDFDHFLWELDRERKRGAARARTTAGVSA